jgi:hypothetical protein
MLALFGFHLQSLADHLLAPFVTLGVVAGGAAIVGAMVGRLDALGIMSDADADAHVQRSYYTGLVRGGYAAAIPVICLLVEALR